MNPIVEKVVTLWPEMVMLTGAVVCLMTGLSSKGDTRRASVWVAAGSLILAGILTVMVKVDYRSGVSLAGMIPFVKLAVVSVGGVLLMIVAHVPDQLKQTREAEAAKGTSRFDPGNVMRGEFFAFFLFSLTGVMLTAGADDLVWLFLALELTSLPTYMMVATSRDRIEAQESAVKYFFLGALAAAIFLYGFTFIYGATGYTDFTHIREYIQTTQGGMDNLLLMGIVLAVVGICFKIAAVPMHFYAADVYEGASSSVAAFLAFVPKTAGFVALLLVLGLVGWPLPEPIAWLIAGIAVVTMTVGNVLGLVQRNIKRALAYSSIAQSGYILVGVLVGPAVVGSNSAIGNGVAAVLFYLLAYGFSTLAAFAVLGCVHIPGKSDEATTYDDLSGLVKHHPALAGVMVIAMLSLLGLPPMVGFLGKIYLFGSAYAEGWGWLVIVAVINSAISAGYYLPIASVCIFGKPREDVESVGAPSCQAGAIIAAILAVVLGVVGGGLVDRANEAGRMTHDRSSPVDTTAQFSP